VLPNGQTERPSQLWAALAGKIACWPKWPGPTGCQKRTAGPGLAGLAKQEEFSHYNCLYCCDTIGWVSGKSSTVPLPISGIFVSWIQINQ